MDYSIQSDMIILTIFFVVLPSYPLIFDDNFK